MKKIVIFLFCLTLSLIVFGQIETKNLMVNLEEVEVTPPKFTGVENVAAILEADRCASIKNFLIKNVNYPKSSLDSYKEGSEIIQFVVTPNGNLTNFEVINSVCPKIDEEVIRVLTTTNGMWKPGLNNGKRVAMEKEVSMVFCVEKSEFNSIKKHFVHKVTVYFNNANKKLFVKHSPQKALKQYDKGIRYLPNDKALLYMRGLCRYECGDEDGARRDWNRIVSLGGVDVGVFAYDAGEMKGYDEMTKILAKNSE